MNLKFEQFPKSPNFVPENLMIVLHGYGSNAKDLISLAPDFADSVDKLLIVSPNAPFNFEMMFPDAYQWYSLFDRSTEAMLLGFYKSYPILKKFIDDQLEKWSLSYENLILAGFSQGGMMAIHAGIMMQENIKGIISFSGYGLVDPELEKIMHIKPKVLLCHGDMDMVVLPQSYHATREYLQSKNFDVQSVLSQGLSHGIDYRCIEKAKEFLKSL